MDQCDSLNQPQDPSTFTSNQDETHQHFLKEVWKDFKLLILGSSLPFVFMNYHKTNKILLSFSPTYICKLHILKYHGANTERGNSRIYIKYPISTRATSSLVHVLLFSVLGILQINNLKHMPLKMIIYIFQNDYGIIVLGKTKPKAKKTSRNRK